MRFSVRTGFTLLEIMIVLVLIAIVSGIALPKLQISQYRVDGAMRTLQGALQQAERGAVQRQVEVAVSFDTANKRVRIHYDLNRNHIVDAGEDVVWKPLEEGNHFAAPPAGITGPAGMFLTGQSLSTSPEGFPTVYYHRDGAASTSYQLFLQSSSTNTNDFRGLVVTQATGRVELYRYGNGTWSKVGL